MSADRIINVYRTLAGLYTLAASMIWSVNTLFLLDAGLGIGEVFVANALFSVGMVLFEIPTGVIADTMGRRVSYLLSVAVLGATTILYLAAAQAGSGVVVFGAISLLMGLGFTFFSGALEAWLVDALQFVGSDAQLDHVFARSAQISGSAMFLGTIGGGFLGQIDLAVPYIARAVLLAFVFLVAASLMQEIGFQPRTMALRELPREMRQEAAVGLAYGWNQPGLRRLMIAASIRGTFFGWGFYAAQPYFLELLDRDAVWVVGVVTALLSLATIVGNQVVEVLSRRCRRRTTLLAWSSAVSTVAAVGMGVTNNFYVAVGCLLILAGAMGVIMPVRQAYLHHVTPSAHRATVVSFDAMVSSVGSVGGQVGLGRVSDARGFGPGYVVGGAFTVLALPFLFAVRRVGGDADRITGVDDADGVAGTCPSGLPRNTGIESHPVPAIVGASGGAD